MASELSTKKVVAIKLIIIVTLALLLGISCFFSKPIEKFLGIGKKESGFLSSGEFSKDDLTIHYIDVGQADSTLIYLPDGTIMLIDAGKAANDVSDYLKTQDIKVIDYFILTHSDLDHVGGAAKVLENFEVKNIYRPFQIAVESATDKTPIADEDLGGYVDICPELNYINTKAYKNFITAAYNETYTNGNVQVEASVTVSYDGLTIDSKVSSLFTLEFFAPIIRAGGASIKSSLPDSRTEGYPTKYYGNNTAESKNAASPVLLLEYKDDSFMFTGDAPSEVEEDFLSSLTAAEKDRFKNVDVFQAGHHGSKGSNCQELLDLIVPSYCVVSCGKDNDYGHPNEEFLDRLNSLNHNGITDYLLRTDTMGTIVFGYYNGKLAYTAIKQGDGVVVYWWYIALGTFIVLSIIVISVKFSKNKKTTAKRFVSQTKKVLNSQNKKK